jgi:3-dehydroquinate dehydratase
MSINGKKVRKGFYTYNGHVIVNRELGGQKHWAIFEDAPEGCELPMSMYHITNFNTKRECIRHIDALQSWARQPVIIGA